MRSLALISILVACSACPGNGGFPPPKQLDTVEQAVAKLAAGRAKATTFRADTVSDYWLSGQRLKGEVRMMGTPGAKVRFNALNPAGGDVLLDLACDGTSFVLIDKQNNCALTGPCDASSIAQLIRVPLAPDDFFYLAVGQTPTLDGATGKVTWDSKRGYEIVVLESAAGSQTIEIDARDGRFDVMKSEMRDPAGKMIWLVEHKGFTELVGEDEAGTTLRVPGSSRFRSSSEQSDAIVDWNERSPNAVLPEKAFVLTDPTGLNTCVKKQP